MENENSKKKQLIGLVIFVVAFLAIKYLLPSLWQLAIAHQFAVLTGAVFLVAGILAAICWSSMPRTAIICGGLSLFSLALVTMNLFHEASEREAQQAQEAWAKAHPAPVVTGPDRFDEWRNSPERAKYINLMTFCQSLGNSYSHCKEQVSRDSGIYPPN